MVGSSRTWNTDEPGLGRPKALPSSAPCRASVICGWRSVGDTCLSVSTCASGDSHGATRTHATSANPPLPPRRRLSTHLCPPHIRVSDPRLSLPSSSFLPRMTLCSAPSSHHISNEATEPDACAARCVLLCLHWVWDVCLRVCHGRRRT